ncbi:MAG: hypothetical protein J5778_10475 [Clostridiales bacterium]|nr:hypothetical protein [Clostridiales bacterium]
MDYSDERMTSGDIILTIFFLGSFFPYGHIIYTGINGIYFGLQGFVHAYGLAAMIIDAVYMTFYLLLPICLIYQIWYAVHVMKKHRILKIISLAAVGTVILGFIIVIPVSDCIVRAAAEEDPVRIREYLAGKYGEEFASDVKIVASGDFDSSTISRYYNVYTDVLPVGSYFTVHNDPPRDDVYVDDLIEQFTEANPGYEEDLSEYLDKKYGLPDDMDLDMFIKTIDLSGYCDGDDYEVLFDRTDYEISGIDVHVLKHTYASVLESIGQVRKDIYSSISDKVDRLLVLYIEDSGHRVVYANLFVIDGEEPYVEIRDDWGDVFGKPVEDYRIDLE